jgi:hypothetical protein
MLRSPFTAGFSGLGKAMPAQPALRCLRVTQTDGVGVYRGSIFGEADGGGRNAMMRPHCPSQCACRTALTKLHQSEPLTRVTKSRILVIVRCPMSWTSSCVRAGRTKGCITTAIVPRIMPPAARPATRRRSLRRTGNCRTRKTTGANKSWLKR